MFQEKKRSRLAIKKLGEIDWKIALCVHVCGRFIISKTGWGRMDFDNKRQWDNIFKIQRKIILKLGFYIWINHLPNVKTK